MTGLRRLAGAYGRRCRAALRQPYTLLTSQLLVFLGVSLYVKLAQVCFTPEYAGSWVRSGRLVRNCLQAVQFCGQEICLFSVLMLAVVLWRRCDPTGTRPTRALATLLGLVVLPVLSITEVLGLAHFAFFLTPLGPEEVRTIVWAPMIISSSNVMEQPAIVAGVVLAVVGYYLVPLALWAPRTRLWQGSRPAYAVLVLVAGIAVASLPKPIVADAQLAPHPLLWMLLGNRPQPAWADTGGDAAAASVLAGHRGFAGRPRYTVTEHPRNVVVLVLESTRANSVALYNPVAAPGRNLLRFKDETVIFDQMYAPVPTSAHALFSILYGLYPYLGPFWSSSERSVAADSMAQLFHRAGYATHLYITSDLNFDNVRSYAATGFDRVLDPNDWPGQENYALLPWGRDDRLLLEESKRFMTAMHKRPFFLFAMTSNPHHPYAADQLFDDAPAGDDQAAYERLVTYDLDLVGELYTWMKVTGIAEHTLLLVLGDHGEAFGEHPGNYGHAAFIYDENVHVPCFILHPRRLGLPRHIPQLGSQVDLRQTIVDILGMHDTEHSDGMSLLREDPERLVANFTENGVTRFGLRDARFSYIYMPHSETEQVFDRRSDPHEAVNIAEHERALTATYHTRLRRWEAQHELSLAKVLR